MTLGREAEAAGIPGLLAGLNHPVPVPERDVVNLGERHAVEVDEVRLAAISLPKRAASSRVVRAGKTTADRGPARWPLPAGLTRKDFLTMSLDQPDQGPEPHASDEQLLQQLVEHVRQMVELMRFSNFVIPPDGDPEA